jgi:aqualysin 1
MVMKRSLGVMLPIVLVAACSDQSAPTAAPAPTSAGRYIVVLKERPAGSPSFSMSVAAENGARPSHVYSNVLNGFAAELSTAQVNALRSDPRVAYIEADGIVTKSTTQTGATWGLDRIDQRNLPLNSTYNYSNTGNGVNAYIIDTGIRLNHSEFGARAVSGFDAVDGGSADDCDGHGTHVAGTVGGSTYGVAKNVKLYAVRVLDCSGSGTWSGVIAGMDWVANNHVKPAVANMSLGGNASTSINDAVARMTAAGVTVVVAAGNERTDACRKSPASAPSAITVGATGSSDSRASYSNHGACLDIFAPGSGITSAWYSSSTATNTISGTSMASPHVAGVAALYLQSNPNASPSAVSSALVANGTTGVVGDARRNSPNVLLFSNY